MIDYHDLDGSTVCICAPVGAMREVAELEARLGLAGAIVLAPVLPVDETSQVVTAPLQRRKIATAHAVVVANPGGHVGSATAREIAYAMRQHVPVTFLVDPPRIEVEPDQYAAMVSRATTRLVVPASPQTAEIASGTLGVVTDGTGARRAWCHVVRAQHCADQPDNGSLEPSTYDLEWPSEQFVALEVEFLGEPDPEREQATRLRRSRPRSAAGAGLLVRDADGRVLLVAAPAWPGGWRLPGAVVEGGEYPREAAGRGAARLLGVPLLTASLLGAPLMQAGDLLVVDHVDDETDAETVTEYVYDGGVIDLDHAQHLQAATAGTSRAGFVAPDEVTTLVAPRMARRIHAALARLADPAAPVSIERGIPPGRGTDWDWRDGDRFPPGMPIRQVSVWAFDADGRVLLQHRVAEHRFALPGGRPEPGDQSLIATAAREALEESQIVLDTDRAVVFGYQTTYQDPGFPDGLVQVRVAAPIARYLPIAPDADPQLDGARLAYRRYLVDVGRAAEVLDFGPSGCLQADAAADVAREVLGLPVDRPAADGYRDHGDPPGDTGAVHPAEHQPRPDNEHTTAKEQAALGLDFSSAQRGDEQ